jgi:hypothetical protein
MCKLMSAVPLLCVLTWSGLAFAQTSNTKTLNECYQYCATHCTGGGNICSVNCSHRCTMTGSPIRRTN